MPPRYAVPAVDGALSILETLGATHKMGITELARKLDLSKGSIYRLLATLVRRGYVEKDADTDRYQLTYRLLAVGSRVADRFGLREMAQPVMERVGSETGETVNLGVLDGFRTVSVYLVQSPQPLSIHMRVGGVSAHASATGKILLASLPTADLDRKLAGRRLDRLTPRTIKSRAALVAELGRVRKQGFAIDDEESSIGLRCAGAPVFNHQGVVVAALSLVAPAHRLTTARLPAAIVTVQAAAQEISTRLGFAGEWPARTKPATEGGRSADRDPAPARTGGRQAGFRITKPSIASLKNSP